VAASHLVGHQLLARQALGHLLHAHHSVVLVVAVSVGGSALDQWVDVLGVEPRLVAVRSAAAGALDIFLLRGGLCPDVRRRYRLLGLRDRLRLAVCGAGQRAMRTGQRSFPSSARCERLD